MESIEASDWINTSDFEDDPNDEIGFKNQLENGDESVEDLVGALTIAEVKIVPINLSLGDDFENHIEEFFAWALKQTEEADKQQNLRDPSENDVVIRSDDLAVETSTTKQQRKFESIVPFDDDFSDNDSKDCGDQERQSIHSHDCHYNQNIHSDDEDFEDTEWQCMYCSDWNSIHEYFCFTYALTQTEEAYEQNSLGNYFKNKANQDFATETSINQQIKVKRSQPFTYNDFDSDDENWQCLHCKDWNSIEEYFCFTCALTQTEETYAKMN